MINHCIIIIDYYYYYYDNDIPTNVNFLFRTCHLLGWLTGGETRETGIHSISCHGGERISGEETRRDQRRDGEEDWDEKFWSWEA